MAISPVLLNWNSGTYLGNQVLSDFPAAGDLLVILIAWENPEGSTAVVPTLDAPSVSGWTVRRVDIPHQSGIGAGGIVWAWRTATGDNTNADRRFDAFFSAAAPSAAIYVFQAFRADSATITVVTDATAGAFTAGDLSATVTGSGNAATLLVAGTGDTGLFTLPSDWEPGFDTTADGATNILYTPGGAANRALAAALWTKSVGSGSQTLTVPPYGEFPAGDPAPGSRPWGMGLLTLTEGGGGPPPAQTVAPGGVATGQGFGSPHGIAIAPVLPKCVAPVRVVEHACQQGSWDLKNTRVLWKLGCDELPLNPATLTVKTPTHWSAPTTLAGDVILSQTRELDETLMDGSTRPGTIRDLPHVIEMSFPRLPPAFYHWMRRLRSFATSFKLEITLFDALDPEPLATSDYHNYYSAVGAWKADQYTVYRNGVALPAGSYQVDPVWGIVRFFTAQSPTDAITATYTWNPTCQLQGELGASFPLQARQRGFRESEVKIVCQELRPPTQVTGAVPLLPGGIASAQALGTPVTYLPSFVDTFSRANGGIGNLETGQTWVQTGWEVQGGQGVQVSGTLPCLIDTGTADGYVEVTISGSNDPYPATSPAAGFSLSTRLIMRFVTASSFVELSQSDSVPGFLALKYFNGSVNAYICTLAYRGLVTGDRLGVKWAGRSYEIYRNGVRIASGTDSTSPNPVVASTQWGFANPAVDDFKFYRPAEIPLSLVPAPTFDPAFADHFNRQDSYLGWLDTGPAWQIDGSYANTHLIANNKAHLDNPGVGAVVKTGAANGVLVATLKRDPAGSTDATGQLEWRFLGKASRYYVAHDNTFGTGAKIIKQIGDGSLGGDFVTIAAQPGPSYIYLQDNDLVWVELDGNNITLYRNRAVFLTGTDSYNNTVDTHGFLPGFLDDWQFFPNETVSQLLARGAI